MKTCSYCGRENPDDAPNCSGCGLDEFEPQPGVQSSETERPNNLVLLATCATLGEANSIASKLKAAGIEAFIPDESLTQMTGVGSNDSGHVRVEVRREDCIAVKKLLLQGENSMGNPQPLPPPPKGKKVIASMEVTQTGEILERLKKAGVPVSVRTTTEENGLDISEILVDGAYFDRGCDVVEDWSEEKQAEQKKKGCCVWCRKCGSRNIQTIPHDSLGRCYRCKDCGYEFPY